MVFSSTIVALPIARAPTWASRTRPRVESASLQSLALASEQRDRLERRVVEEQLDMAGAANAHHRLVAPDREAGQALVDQEHRNALGAGVADR